MSKEGKKNRGETIRLLVTLPTMLGVWLVSTGRLAKFPDVAILY